MTHASVQLLSIELLVSQKTPDGTVSHCIDTPALHVAFRSAGKVLATCEQNRIGQVSD